MKHKHKLSCGAWSATWPF